MSDIVWTPEQGTQAQDPEVRGLSWNNLLASDESYSTKWRTASDIRITPDKALQSTVILSCCRIIAETIATLPLCVYRRKSDGSQELAYDVPLYKVLHFAPNSWQTKFEFIEQVCMHIGLWGNSYSQIISGRYGAVTELQNLHPSRMQVERLENGRLRYSYTNPQTGRLERYTQDQIMHVRWTPEPDGIKGMVPIEVSRDAIALARSLEIHASKFWANSARPGVVLTTDGSLSAESAERLRDNWERIHRGSERAYKTAILTNGLKATELGFTNEASQFVDSRKYQCEELCRVYRIPMHLVQGTSGGNLEVQGQEFVTYTLMPWLERIQAAISRSLIYNDDLLFAAFDVRGLLRSDSNSRAGYYSTMMGLGIYSVNEVRSLEGLAPLGPEADKHFVAMNMQTLEDAAKPKPDPSQMPGAPPPAAGGVPSLPGVKTGEAPKESEKGEASTKKPEMEDAIEESSADWEDAIEGRAFCATGEGGGIDNSCGDDEGGSSSPAAANGKGGSCPAPCHEPDVNSDKNKDGVTDAARVGCPAFEVPPPPAVGRVPNLDPYQRSVEDAFISHFESDPEKVSSQFRDLVVAQGDPPTFGTDDAKCLTSAWSHPDPEVRAENRATLNTILHQTANAIAKRAFLQHLDTLKEGDEIMVTVGGCGAGKGFALKNVPAAMEMKSRAKVVWDSAGDQNATENPWILKEAESRGLKVNYVFVHADPQTQWADPDRGVVKRASDPKDGRMVDAKVFADSYAIGAKNHHAFHQANKDNKSASFVFLDNTSGPKQVAGVPKEALSLDADKLAAFAESKVQESSAPPRVKAGALLGRRIWGKK